MGPMLRWSWLLGVALMAPAALPAGGADVRQPQVRRRVGVGGHLHVASDAPRPSPSDGGGAQTVECGGEGAQRARVEDETMCAGHAPF